MTSLDLTFAALADPTRRAILTRLTQGSETVTRLAEPFSISLPAVSKHLRVLERAGLIERERQGRTQRCRLVAVPLYDAAQWIGSYARFWELHFAELAKALAQDPAAHRD
ncbi:MAG: winged helix-turn-helix transcriptional regulator [Candidatus Lambdaproteobacteria bacterium]|nr:winged helix-turn-helix transcriptional regulator [Candidatus Lambdaproteobacteria bacterium]